MSLKSLIVFVIVTIITIVAAGISVTNTYKVHKIGFTDKPVIPNFAENAIGVTEITVENSDRKITVKRDGENWKILERQNYLASNQIVADLLLNLSEIRYREAKTTNAGKYRRLHVEDVSGKGAKSTLLSVKSKNGELVRLIVGKENTDVVGPSNGGRYIRNPNDKQSWLVSGRLDVPSEVNTWVDPELLHVASNRIKRVIVTQPNGQKMIVSRADKEKFKIDNMPNGGVVEYQSDINNMADGLDKLEFEDVMARGKIEFIKNKTISTQIETGDGLIMNVRLIDINDGNFWSAISAFSNKSASELVKKEVNKINNKVSNWVYQLPSHKYRYMSRKFSDVLKGPKSEKDK